MGLISCSIEIITDNISFLRYRKGNWIKVSGSYSVPLMENFTGSLVTEYHKTFMKTEILGKSKAILFISKTTSFTPFYGEYS